MKAFHHLAAICLVSAVCLSARQATEPGSTSSASSLSEPGAKAIAACEKNTRTFLASDYTSDDSAALRYFTKEFVFVRSGSNWLMTDILTTDPEIGTTSESAVLSSAKASGEWTLKLPRTIHEPSNSPRSSTGKRYHFSQRDHYDRGLQSGIRT
jgi:hypothetical protein